MIVAALIAWPPADESNSHWAFQARGAVAAPAIADRCVRTPVDAFVLDKLRKVGLTPAPEAERGVSIRRLFFDLTGLPPTPDDVAAFLDDRSADAYERLVERVLASPRYGEKWGRHWLDVVRYS